MIAPVRELRGKGPSAESPGVQRMGTDYRHRKCRARRESAIGMCFETKS
jgi:hypothetical protein